MVLMFAILLWIIGECISASGKDWEASERNAERRHKELMEVKKKKTTKKKKTVRREVHAPDGRYAVEEVTEEEE